MSNLYEAKMRLQETALALTAHELTDYYAIQSGPAYQDYLEEQMANAARDYVAAVQLSDDKPIGWDDLPGMWEEADFIGGATDVQSDDEYQRELKRRIQRLEN